MTIAIVGAGGHGRVAFECLELSGTLDAPVAFFDDRWAEIREIEGIPVLGGTEKLAEDARFEQVFVAIGENKARLRVTRVMKRCGKSLLTIVHPRTAISPRAALGEGTIAVAGTVVNRGARVGRGVILNTLCSVGHDCVVNDFAQITPGVNLGGAAVIGEGVYLGIGTKVVPQARIGAWSVVGAGSVVLGVLPERSFCKGIPARAIRKLRGDELPDV